MLDNLFGVAQKMDTHDFSYLFAGMADNPIIASTTIIRGELSFQLLHLQPLTHAALIHIGGKYRCLQTFYFGCVLLADKESSVHCTEYVFTVLSVSE